MANFNIKYELKEIVISKELVNTFVINKTKKWHK